MARTIALQEGQTLGQLAQQLGISVDELLGLNPNLTAGGLVAGLQLNVPDAVASSTAQAPSDAPTADLATNATGLFQEMLKDFQEAFKVFLSAPGFVRGAAGEPTKRVEAGTTTPYPQPGFATQEAEFLRANEDIFEQRYGEQVMRQFGETGELPTLSPAEFLKTINVREEMEMRTNESRTGRPRVPSTGVRRLRF